VGRRRTTACGEAARVNEKGKKDGGTRRANETKKNEKNRGQL
jgi:hypothetical protein